MSPERPDITIGCLPDSYNNSPGRPDLGKYPLNTSVCDTLVRLDEQLGVEPMLAKGWEFRERTNTYRFHLREGVRFHNGRELSSEDVKYTFDLMVSAMPDNHQRLGPDSVRVVTRHSLDITPVMPNRQLVQQLVHPVWGVYCAGSDPLQPQGCGPYRFREYRKGERLAVERFHDYWNPRRAAAARHIEFVFTDDTPSRIAALAAGHIDLAMDVPGSRKRELEDAPGVKVVRSGVGAYNALTFNIGGVAPHDLGKDPAIREAVAAAIDRSSLLEEVWDGCAEDGRTWIPRPVLGEYASRVQGAVFDPDRARQLLDQAGWQLGSDGIRAKGGRRLTLLHVLGGAGDSDPRDSVAAAEHVRGQLRNAGIDAQLDGHGSIAMKTGSYDLYHGVANQNEAYPGRLPDIIHYSKKAASRFRAPGGNTDEAIERCRAAADMDSARRYAADAAHELVDVEHVVVPLVGLYRIWGLREDLEGFVPHPSLTNQRWEGLYRAARP